VPIIEECHYIDIDQLVRERVIALGVPRDGKYGPLRFRYDGFGLLTIFWSREHRQQIVITSYRHPWGTRYLFEAEGHRVRRLYLVPGENPPWFRTRHSYPIRYHSWHLGKRRRRERTVQLLRQSLGVTGLHTRPRGMRRSVWMSRLVKIGEIENDAR
jgi:hypothetical protein